MAVMKVRFLPRPSDGETHGNTPCNSATAEDRVDVFADRNRTKETMSAELNVEELIESAREAQESSHAPYSKFHVGAALLTEDGEVYQSCNIEAKPSANTQHAEQRAMGDAVEDGHREFVALALVTSSSKILPPCGNCRQTLATFQEDLTIIVANDETHQMYQLDELLPYAYTGRSMDDAPTEG